MQKPFLAALITLVLYMNIGLCKEDAKPDTPLQVGDKAPDFEVEALDGKKLKLSDRFGKDHKSGRTVVLLFSRAHW